MAVPTTKIQTQFWTTDRRGAVEIATYSNPPYNLVTKEVFDELEALVVACEDPAIRAVVIQADPHGVGFRSTASRSCTESQATRPCRATRAHSAAASRRPSIG